MEQLDPEMLKNMDLLLVLDVLENEKDWEMVEDLEVIDGEIDADGIKKGTKTNNTTNQDKTSKDNSNKEDAEWIAEDF